MKFELKTENENYPKSFTKIFRNLSLLAFLIIFCNVSLKLGIISRQYQIDFDCRLLAVEKSSSSFRKLSRLTNLKSKQRIWEFCREVVK